MAINVIIYFGISFIWVKVVSVRFSIVYFYLRCCREGVVCKMLRFGIIGGV